MAIVAHFDMELHHMDLKAAFFNEDLYKNVYMLQLEGFILQVMQLWCVSLRYRFMDLSLLQGSGT